MAQPTVDVLPMADEVFDRIKAGYEACKNKKKWKTIVVSDRGQRMTVTNKNGRFVINDKGVEITMMPMKLYAKLQKHGSVGNFIFDRNNMEDITEEEVSVEATLQRMARFQTGNHNPRNHPVRVPTQPGQPVRG
jgi:hypothetical protein